MRKLIAGLLISSVMTLSTLLTLVLSADTSATINASVTVSGKYCGIEVQQDSIDFGSVIPGESSDSVTRTVQNTGNSGMVYCQYSISGTDWTSNSYKMDSEQTDYNCSTGTGIDCQKTSWTDLTNNDVTYLGLDAGVTANTNFQVTIPQNAVAGTYSQTITITLLDP